MEENTMDTKEFRQRMATLSPEEAEIAMEVLVTMRPETYCKVLVNYIHDQEAYINTFESIVADRSEARAEVCGK